MKKTYSRRKRGAMLMREAFASVLQDNVDFPCVGCEVGVFKGDLSSLLLERFDNLTLYMVDPYVGLRRKGFGSERMKKAFDLAFSSTLAFQDRRIMLIARSLQVATIIQDGSLDFVYIDACHWDPHITNDINVWYPKVRSGGLFGGHDYRPDKHDVKGAVDMFAAYNDYEVQVDNTNWWFIKR